MTRIPLVYVVDDDVSIRESVAASLRTAGYRVEACASAEDFLASALGPQADCLVVDIRMAGMTGPELQRTLVARQRRTPIVFITAHGDDGVRQRLLADGAVACLDKPFTKQTLLVAVNAALGRDEP